MATNTAGSTARNDYSQDVQTLRFKVNYNDAGIATGNGKQFLPAGAIVLRTAVLITTVFNAATTNVLSIGFEASTYANLATSAQTISGTAGMKKDLIATGTALVPLAADSQVFALYTQTGTAATTGVAYVVIEYVLNNDFFQ